MKIKFTGKPITVSRVSKEISKELNKLIANSSGEITSCSLYYSIRKKNGTQFEYIDTEIDCTHGNKYMR